MILKGFVFAIVELLIIHLDRYSETCHIGLQQWITTINVTKNTFQEHIVVINFALYF